MADSIPAEHGDVMSEPEQESSFESDNVNVGLIATIALVGAACVLAIALAMTALVRAQTRTFGDEIGAYADLGTVKRLKAEQKAKLEAPAAVVDKGKGSYSVPIDRAMNTVITEIQANPSLATMAPPAAAAPAAAPSESPPQETAPADKDGKTKKPGASVKGRVGMDPKNGAPVTPASAPAPHG
jgi:hypothetical protein